MAVWKNSTHQMKGKLQFPFRSHHKTPCDGLCASAPCPAPGCRQRSPRCFGAVLVVVYSRWTAWGAAWGQRHSPTGRRVPWEFGAPPPWAPRGSILGPHLCFHRQGSHCCPFWTLGFLVKSVAGENGCCCLKTTWEPLRQAEMSYSVKVQQDLDCISIE